MIASERSNAFEIDPKLQQYSPLVRWPRKMLSASRFAAVESFLTSGAFRAARRGSVSARNSSTRIEQTAADETRMVNSGRKRE